MDGTYSLSDIASVTRDNDGCMGGSWWVILLFLFAMGGNGFGFGNRGNVATTEDLASGFNFSSLQGKTNDILAAVNGVNQNIGNAVCTSTYELASKIDNCCCTTKEAIGQVRYDMAVQNSELKAMIQQDKIESLQNQINALQLQSALCGVPKINPYGYGVYAYPTCAPTCANI